MTPKTFHIVMLLQYLVLVFYCLSILFTMEFDDSKPMMQIMMKFYLRYMTFWNLLMHVLYFVICVVDEAIRDNSKNGADSRVEYVKNFIFTVFFFPVTLFSVTGFWAVFSYDHNLIMPPYMFEVCPVWLNHGLHTIVVVGLVGEMVCSPRQPVMSPLKGFGVFSAAWAFGDMWIFDAIVVQGVPLYPAVEAMSTSQVIAALLAIYIYIAMWYFVGVVFFFPAKQQHIKESSKSTSGQRSLTKRSTSAS